MAFYAIAGNTYKVQDPLEAVEQFFLFIYGIDIKCEKAVHHIWNFLQLYIFNITTSDDNFPGVKTLIKDLSE